MNHLFHGPLRRCESNPRYFSDETGTAIYLTGAHTWPVFQDNIIVRGGDIEYVDKFDYEGYLQTMKKYNHNFLRLWCRESSCGMGKGITYPMPYKPVNKLMTEEDMPKYDLTQLNPEYFERLRERILLAKTYGIYVSIMLFEAWSVDSRGGRTPWIGHPYNRENNINGIDGNPDLADQNKIALSQENDSNPFKPEEHLRVHTLDIPKITELQKNYVREVVTRVNDLDNVMFEIANEALRWSKYWQYEMVDYIKELEKGLEKQHPVWMSHLVPAQNESLYVSHADAISPGVESTSENYCINPPASDGRKIIIADTDHLGGIWGTSQWAWKSFLRGLNPIFMDNCGETESKDGIEDPDNPISMLFGRMQYELPKDWQEPVRIALGQTLSYAQKIDLSHMYPSEELSSTGYCLANAGEEYLVYQPESGLFKLGLYGAAGPFLVEWFYPQTGKKFEGKPFYGGTAIEFTPPYEGEVVMYLKRFKS